MRLTFQDVPIEKAPKGFVRVRIVENGTTRLLVDAGVETLEIGSKMRVEIDRRKLVLLVRSVAATAKQHKLRKIALQLDRTPFPKLQSLPLPELGSLIAQALAMGNYEFTQYKSEPKGGFPAIDEVLICGETPKTMRAGFTRGALIAEEVNATRSLANMPGGDMTPKVLAKAARAAAKGLPIKLDILGRKDLEKRGMGAIIGVAKGSEQEPQLIVMRYDGGKKGEKPIVLVGKGVTFDTGGLNLKPESGIYEMHMDMSGGAAVIHACVLAAKLKVKRNVIAIVPAVENMPSGSSYRPGDQLRSLSGKTIEVLNTDAEGRIILADALTYAKRFDPALVIDVATLTGAAVVALGQQASALLTRDEELQGDIVRAGEESGDYVWPLPLWDEYEDMVKGHFGDVANISTQGNSRYGGVISGAMFLWQFAKELSCPWAHLDIAPRMVAAPNEHLAKGAAGAPVRLLLRLIETYGSR